jgi:hypothetical protein
LSLVSSRAGDDQWWLMVSIGVCWCLKWIQLVTCDEPT